MIALLDQFQQLSLPVLIMLGLFVLIILIAIWDIFIQKRHIILHNFPVVGHLRYLLEVIGPELRQYWVANDKEEKPFNRDERRWVYSTAKKQLNTFGFGTTEELYSVGYPILKHAAFPFPAHKASYPGSDSTVIPCIKVMGEFNKRKRLYRPASIINISGMSFGSLGKNAITALNRGALAAKCFHNTGEGGISDYHNCGANLVWQIGTAYFACRTKEGRFSIKKLVETVTKYPQIRAIEIKLSQGAKPGKGGILPAIKVSAEIAKARGIEEGKQCVSPNFHSEFSTVDELIDFIERIADKSGLPVGIKSAVGELVFWEELAKRMKARKQGPDFIAIDGGEGGTGAAPLSFSDHVALPFKVGFARVYKLFQEAGIEERIVWIGSAKLGFPDRAVVGLAMGCDMINIAREAMLAIGCIQAQKCHTNHCPAGIATHSPWLEAGLNTVDKAIRFAYFIQGFRKELLALSHAAGYEHPSQFRTEDIELSSGVSNYKSLSDILGYKKKLVQFSAMKDYMYN